MTLPLSQIHWGVTAKRSWAYIYSYRVEIMVYSDWLRTTDPATRDAEQKAYVDYRDSLLNFHHVTERTPQAAEQFWAEDEKLKPLMYNNTYRSIDPLPILESVARIALNLENNGVPTDDAVRVASNGSLKTAAELETALAPFKDPDELRLVQDSMRKNLHEWALGFGLKVTNDAYEPKDATFEWADPTVRTATGEEIMAGTPLN